MGDLVIQASLNGGEWSPKLFARVDLQKYRSGAALLENFFVDYRGGASTRPGTQYVLQCYKPETPVRLIPFQASFEVGYVLEFGHEYIRFFFNGAPVLEDAENITGASQTNPVVIQVPVNGYLVDDWIFVEGVNGMTQLNGKYYKVLNAAGPSITLGDINGNPIDGTGFSPYTSGGTSSRVYTIGSPYDSADLRRIKFAQNVSQLILCHPDYDPHVLTLINPTSWTLLPITFGTTAATPTGVAATTSLAAGSVFYSYAVSSVDANGQESLASILAGPNALQDLRTTAGTITISWNAAPGAVSYNIYKTNVQYLGVVPPGMIQGYIGSATGTSFVDDNIAPDYSQTPPIARNPFLGRGVESILVTNPGAFTAVPVVNIVGASTIAASAAAVLGVSVTPGVTAGGAGYAVNDSVTFPNGVILIVATTGGGGSVTSWKSIFGNGSVGTVTSGAVPANPVAQVSTSGGGAGVTTSLTWGLLVVQVLNQGAGYVAVPAVTFSPGGGAAATAVLSADSNGFPSVPGFFQQRLVLAAPEGAPQTFYMSQPGAYFNFNVSQIAQADDAITGTLVSGQLNTIRSMVPQTSGLLMFTDRNNWLINGGSNGSAISPFALVANAQSFNGISDVPPIVANFDVLYVQAKGSIVRDSAFNIYSNVFTGTDISAIASHLFYGFTVDEWCWAEEPFKLAHGIRSEGTLLNLTFLKEQEFVGWTHSVTNGLFKSTTSVVESTVDAGQIDAVYIVVQREINGNTTQYIERFADRVFPNGVEDAWCVDCGIRYEGAPISSFTGGEFLAGATVTGLADGQVITPFVMPVNGNFTLPVAASKVTIGEAFTCRLQTLPIDIGDPTIQGKVKKTNSVDLRVSETLGLFVGGEFGSGMVPMKDLIRGNVSSMLTGLSNQIVTDLVTGDSRAFLNPAFTVYGQYCVEQRLPYPATVLGLITDLSVGDTGSKR